MGVCYNIGDVRVVMCLLDEGYVREEMFSVFYLFGLRAGLFWTGWGSREARGRGGARKIVPNISHLFHGGGSVTLLGQRFE